MDSQAIQVCLNKKFSMKFYWFFLKDFPDKKEIVVLMVALVLLDYLVNTYVISRNIGSIVLFK